MNKISYRWIIPIAIILLPALACNLLGGPPADTPSAPTNTFQTRPTQPVIQYPTEAPNPTTIPELPVTAIPTTEGMLFDTEFPLPEDVQNFQNLREGQINFQTSMSLDDATKFYRDAFTAQGLTELEVATVINDDIISLVFNGAPNGKSIVLQAVVLDANTININIRYEDI